MNVNMQRMKEAKRGLYNVLVTSGGKGKGKEARRRQGKQRGAKESSVRIIERNRKIT